MSRHVIRSLSAFAGAALTAGLVTGIAPAEAARPTASTGHRAVGYAAPQQAAKVSGGRYSRALAKQMNNVRRNHDLRPLRVVPCLNGFAAPWARHMSNTGHLVHQELSPIVNRCHLSSAGEIIAYGGVTPRRMIGMWLDSPGHRELLLEPSFRIAGVAGRRGHGVWWGCIDFGRR